jgi:hypothetical protein
MKFKKKPVEIEAIQYNGNNGSELYLWSDSKVYESPICEPTEDNPRGAYIQIDTLEGTMIGIVGDYIIKGIQGEFYPCKPNIFKQTYDLVD